MDLSSTLLRTVIRTFHSQIPYMPLILDALLTHSVLTHDDLTHLLGPQRKELNRLLAPLKAARLITSHTRAESKDGYQKAVPREYFYVDFHRAVDAVKYKVWKLEGRVKEMYESADKLKTEKAEWLCRTCGREYSDLDVMMLRASAGGFECERCGQMVAPIHAGKDADDPSLMVGHEKLARLAGQLEKIVKLMQRIDGLEVPETTFDSAWERRKEVKGGKGQNYEVASRQAALGIGLKTAKAGTGGVEQTDARNLAVSLTSGDELSRREEEERERVREEKAKQNILPSWIKESTITRAQQSGEAAAAETKIDDEDVRIKDNDGGTTAEKEANEQDAAMRQYWEDMEKEQEERRRRVERQENEEDEEEDEEDDDDDDDEDAEEDEFEDALTPNPPPRDSSPSKRRLDDGEEARTNGDVNGGEKRVKFEENGTRAENGSRTAGESSVRGGRGNANGPAGDGPSQKEEGTSDEDEGDDAFEDVV